MPTLPTPTGYSAPDDLLLGSIPLPSFASGEKYVKDAADEIDSVLGFLYATPLDITDIDTNPIPRPARLLIKRISRALASGRLILAIAAAGEHQELQSYGASLIKEATGLLEQIACRDIVIEGAEKVNTEAQQSAGPKIHNVDPESNVEAFYDRVANPNYLGFGFTDAERGLIR